MEIQRSTPTSLSDWAAIVRFGDGGVRVGRRAFDVTALACENPACPCEVLTLSFREKAPPGRSAAIAFDVTVDLAGDAPAEAQGLGAEADRLAARIVMDVQGVARIALRDALGEKRHRLMTIDETVMSYSRRGQTVPWSHVRAGGRPDDTETFDQLDRFVHDGDEWDVHDHLCANPKCACEDVMLAFHFVDHKGTLSRFGVRVPLGKGTPSFEEPEGVALSEARRIFAAWEVTTRFDREVLRARYECVRAIVQRAEKAAPRSGGAPQRGGATAPRPSPPSLGVRAVGRREACPCGSGKRYKNCCGKQ